MLSNNVARLSSKKAEGPKEINSKFKNYKKMFENLTETISILTNKKPIIECCLSEDSQRALVVAKESDEKIVIIQYELTNYLQVQEFEVVG